MEYIGETIGPGTKTLTNWHDPTYSREKQIATLSGEAKAGSCVAGLTRREMQGKMASAPMLLKMIAMRAPHAPTLPPTRVWIWKRLPPGWSTQRCYRARRWRLSCLHRTPHPHKLMCGGRGAWRAKRPVVALAQPRMGQRRRQRLGIVAMVRLPTLVLGRVPVSFCCM